MRLGLGWGSLFALTVACSGPVVEPDASSDGAVDAGADATVACGADDACDDGLFCNGVETCGASGTCEAGTAPDCDDGIECTSDRCDETRRECVSTPPDGDSDGVADATCLGVDGLPLGRDCDDSDSDRYPGNPEVCDASHDEDCDPATYGSVDADDDGFVAAGCCNVEGSTSVCGDDCDDGDANVSPADAEVCNTRDDDCDGRVDEGLLVLGYLPDCDGDGHGDAAATPSMGCGPPPATPTCATGTGVWVTMGGDCADDDGGRNPGAPEVCNGIDDDCDTLVDDIIGGTVVCSQGQTRACTTSCTVSGTQSCNDACLGWETCTAPEVCNGCDDDNDGANDDGFECVQGVSGACVVSACGTMGTRLCSGTCEWSACAASEACNYCDDDGDGNFWEERPLASVTSSDFIRNCAGSSALTMYGSTSSCDLVASTVPAGDALTAELMDGSAVPQAGAFWITPSGWAQGWGTTEIQITLDAEVLDGATTDLRSPLGGWALLVTRGGTPGVGPATRFGIPSGLTGVGARWHWATYALSGSSVGYPPAASDGVRAIQLNGSVFAPLLADGATSTDRDNDDLEGAAQDLDSTASGVVSERMVLRYTPDDPTTSGVNEESLVISASTPGTGGTITRTYTPTNGLPVGSQPLQVGITSGSYVDTGFSGLPPGFTMGARVRTRVRIWLAPPGSPPTTYYQTISRAGLCP